MADLALALIEFAKLIRVLDENGVVRWEWFIDPVGHPLTEMPAAAAPPGDGGAHLGGLLRALLDRPGNASPPFPLQDAGVKRHWEPISIGSVVDAGIVWDTNTPPDELVISVGATAKTTILNQQIALSALAKLVAVAGGVSGEFGSTRFDGTFPVPDFLSSGSIAGGTNPTVVGLNVEAPLNPSRSATLQLGSEFLAWDCLRLVTLVIEAWVRQQAQSPGDSLFDRIDEHLFAMFGEPQPQVIGQFPLFQDTGTSPGFTEWTSTVLTLQGNAPGALTLLWHLRALLTGNESPDFLSGSFWFPLDAGPAQGAPPTPDDKLAGTYPPPPGTSGGWLGIQETSSGTALVLDLRASDQFARLPLANATGNTLSRPAVTQVEWDALLALPPTIPLQSGQQFTIAQDGLKRRVKIFEETLSGPPGIGGMCRAELVVAPNQPISYLISLPAISLTLPPLPNTEGDVAGEIAKWLLGTSSSLAGQELAPVTDALAVVMKTGISGNADAVPLLAALAGSELTIDVPPLASLSLDMSDPSAVTGTLTLAPITIDQLRALTPPPADLEILIGALTASAGINVNTGALTAIGLTLTDVRITTRGKGVVSGIVGSLLPDLSEVPGFTLDVDWSPETGVLVCGGGKVPVEQTLGPLTVSALVVNVKKDSFTLGLDLSFELGPILVTAHELGIRFPFSAGDSEPFLHGLGLSLDTSTLKLTGMFGEVKVNGSSDYVGGAVVSVVDLFELSAIGGYTQLENGESSLFIFASLVAPLGGPPWVFITGVAGGFGYNRALPPPGPLHKHPFLRVMSGELQLSGSIGEMLVTLSGQFHAQPGQFWVAAGLQFISFGFIHGKIVVVVSFGQHLSFSLLGLAYFGIESIASFELAIEATANEELFSVRAGMSPNSYLIHPKVASLRGDFALFVWHSNSHSGDFLLSIGGYHPNFSKPAHYPALARVGATTTLFGWLHLSVECFFACTPQALMAGADISLWAEIGDIAAGLDVVIDVLMTWDPFYLQAGIRVTVWFEFAGRHEVSVGLEIHTPPFGGLAVVDLELVSFEIAFGSDQHQPPPPKLWEFFANQIGIPAEAHGTDGAKLLAFGTEDEAGLLKVDITAGRATKDQQVKTNKQDGLDAAIPLNPEFAFVVSTRLPINSTSEPSPQSDAELTLGGDVDLTLCEEPGLQATLTIRAPKIGTKNVGVSTEALYDYFPASEFGPSLSTAQADQFGARQAVASLNPAEATIILFDGVEVTYAASPSPSELAGEFFSALEGEPSIGDERYPLPLDWPFEQGQVFKNPKPKLFFSTVAAGIALSPLLPQPGRRQQAREALGERTVSPLRLTTKTAEFARAPIITRLKGPTLVNPPSGVAIIAPPSSSSRSAELFGVSLKVVAPYAPGPIARQRLSSVRRVTGARTQVFTPEAGTTGTVTQHIMVGADEAVHIDLVGGQVRRGQLTFAGNQIVRAVCLTSADEPVADLYAGPETALTLPARCRRVVLIGEGARGPVSQGNTPVAEESVGVEHDTLLLALGRRTFAAYGCVVHVGSRFDQAFASLDAVPGFLLLRQATNLRVHFPPPRPGWSLIISVAPTVSDPGSALEDVRWLSLDAVLSDLHTVVGVESTAFIAAVDSAGPWALDVDLGRKWRLSGVALCTGRPREIAAQLRTTTNWEFVDDRVERPGLGTSSTATLEIGQ